MKWNKKNLNGLEKYIYGTFDKSVVFCARNSVLVKTNVVKSYYTNFKYASKIRHLRMSMK